MTQVTHIQDLRQVVSYLMLVTALLILRVVNNPLMSFNIEPKEKQK